MRPRKLLDVLFILVLGIVSAAGLLGIRSYSAPLIVRYQEARLRSAILAAAGVAVPESETEAAFAASMKQAEVGDFEYYLGPGDVYVFEFAGRGLWGRIEGVVTLDPDLETIRAVQVMAQEETPGLGSRIGDANYLGGFKGKKVAPELTLALRKKASSATEVDAVSGATISSRALVDIINAAVGDFQRRMGR